MSKRKPLSKIHSYFGPSSKVLRPARDAYRVLFVGIIILCSGFWHSYDNYRRGNLNKIQIENVSEAPLRTIDVYGKSIEITQKSEVLLEAKSFGQQLIFDLNPDSNNLFSVYSASFFFIISIALFIVLKNTPKDYRFSKDVSTSLNRFHIIVYIVVIIRISTNLIYNASIQNILGSEFQMQKSANTITILTILTYGLFATLLSVVINFFKQGLVLQEEQDLTV